MGIQRMVHINCSDNLEKFSRPDSEPFGGFAS
jgi:hypothetical protein